MHRGYTCLYRRGYLILMRMQCRPELGIRENMKGVEAVDPLLSMPWLKFPKAQFLFLQHYTAFY